MRIEEIRAALATNDDALNALAAAAAERDDDSIEVLGPFVRDGEGNETAERTRTEFVGLTADEAAEWGRIERSTLELEGQLARAERVAVAATRSGNIVAPNVNLGGDANSADILSTSNLRDARAQAVTAIEQAYADDSVRSDLTERVERGTIVDAQHVALSVSDAYRSAFAKAMAGAPWSMTDDERAATEAVNTVMSSERASLQVGASGWSLPTTVDPTMINTSDVDANPMMAEATIYRPRTNRQTINQMGGAAHEWVAESTQVADGTPTAAPVHIDAHLGDVYVTWSYMADQDVEGLESELRTRISESMDSALATAFETGDGSGKPTGIVTALAAIAANAGKVFTGANTSITKADLDDLQAALQKRHRRSAAFLGAEATYSYLREALSGDELYWGRDLANGVDELLMRRRVLESTLMDEPSGGAFTAGDQPLVYGNLRAAYAIVQRIGMFAVPQPLVTGANGRPTGEQGLVVFHRTGGGLQNPNAAKLLEIVA